MIDQYDNAMRRHAKSIPSLIREIYRSIETQTRYVLTTPEVYSLQNIILIGTGDSYCAALATKAAFEQLTQLPVLVMNPLDLARYYPAHLLAPSPNNPCVIALSNSGRVTRVVEAVTRCRERGSLTVAVTGDRESPLAQNSHKTIHMELSTTDPAPGVRSYAAMLVTLYLLAIRIGEVKLKYTMDTANVYRDAILRACDKMEDSFDETDVQCLKIASLFNDSTYFEFMGSGPDFASAWYGHEKIYEAAGCPATVTDTETWFHVNFFNKDLLNTMSVLTADTRNPGHSRGVELDVKIASMGQRLVVVSNNPEEFSAELSVRVADCEFYWFAPFTQFVPHALIAGYVAVLNSQPFNRGFAGIWANDPSAPSTTNSKFVIV